MTKLISELLDLPERVRKGDFVLNLSKGVNEPQETLKRYVVTPQLVECFNNSLNLIKTAVNANNSKAAYLHGSFGSGKSHFMAVLHLILQHNSAVRTVEELLPVCEKHQWIEDKHFLLVPYHMINAKDMETAIFSGYVDHVSELHPDAPLPGIYLANEIFDNARQHRSSLGDEKFFAELNKGKTEVSEANGGKLRFGKLKQAQLSSTGWDAASFEEALQADPGSKDRSMLVGDLVKNIFSAFRRIAQTTDEAYVELDEGLGILSKHAQSLGYDGLILFLDELILWLSTNSGNLNFVQREANKLVKLVESKNAERPIPIISFVARQRDLRDLIGDTVSGIEQINLSDILSHMEERFDTITLEDRNLPLIAQKRVLKPKSESCKVELADAYEQAIKLQPEIMEILLARDGNKQLFKQVYPFSPALIKALIAISSALQRERTALKIMLEILVKRRDTLLVGDIVPLGDLWDVVADGDDTFSDVMRIRFAHAKKLYTTKLLPMLEEQHSLDLEVDRERAKTDPEVAHKFQAFENDERLIKSLLLAALVEGEETLKDMTCVKLAALNHGNVKSRFSGREYQTVKIKFQEWSGLHGEIRLSGEATNPTVSLQLVGVDTDQIIKAARAYDRPGERQLKIRRMLLNSFGIDDHENLFYTHRFLWRGTQRYCNVLFENVCRATDEALRSSGDDWKLIIDFPFDNDGMSPQDDIDRITKFTEKGESHKTLIWIPQFFSTKTQTELGHLVVIDHLLRGNNLDQHASDLSAQDRETARTILANRQSALEAKLQSILEAAYGIRSVSHPGSLDDSYNLSDTQFTTLYPSLTLHRPVGSTLKEAKEHLLDQALKHQYPKHPKFGQEIKPNKDLRDVLQVCQNAADTLDPRIFVEDSHIRKALRNVCEPLELGSMGETHFVLETFWKTQFNKAIAASEKKNPDVADMKSWIGNDRGLPKEIENLLIMVYAEQTNRAFFRFGTTYMPKLDDMPSELELRQEVLPDESDWVETKKRIADLFGDDLSNLLNATNLANLFEKFTSEHGYLSKYKSDCDALPDRLLSILRKLGLGEEEAVLCDRVKTAKAVREFFNATNAQERTKIVPSIASARIETSSKAMGRSIKSAAAVLKSLMEPHRWKLFEAVAEISDKRKTSAESLLNDLRDSLKMDEFALAGGLAAKLSEADGRAVELLRPSNSTRAADEQPKTTQAKPGWKRLDSGTNERMSQSDLSALNKNLGAKLAENAKRRVSVHWTLEEEEPK